MVGVGNLHIRFKVVTECITGSDGKNLDLPMFENPDPGFLNLHFSLDLGFGF